ncbi:MAG TPA: sialate O-acetylesterase [Pirellulales bacterium]|nr:sialate O-acetylesterase [Pirellulales bacterium]
MKRLFALIALHCALHRALPVHAADLPPPIKVFVLAGQSNMEGQAVVDLAGKDYNDGKGTLEALLGDPGKAPLVRHLKAGDGTWAVRDDVWVRYKREDEPLLKGPLAIGFTVYGDPHHFGPELQFGHVLGDYFENRVLLVKTAWGGKSLFKDFRPPSSGGTVGPYYAKMVAEIHEALDAIPSDFPGSSGAYELAGFVWYQGWNDGVDPEHAVPEYEENLCNLIRDVRQEFKAPKLPVVIGELTGPWVEAPGAWAGLRDAQRKVAERPEFKSTVLFVETHDFVREPEDSPNPGHGHHEFGNAETYFLVGDALGKGMIALLEPAPKPSEALPQPTSRSVREIEGWKVRVDDRLLGDSPDAAMGARALGFLEAKLAEIKAVLPAERLADLQEVTIVMDLNCGDLGAMQYHPGAGWLEDHGFPPDLAKCVHIPKAADLPTRRNINEQPWVVLHELAHAFHDQKLGFEEPRIKAAYEKFKASGHGDAALLYNGKRVKHYGLTNQMEFFAEMTESFFGVNDFFPFNRAELQEAEPELFRLLTEVWHSQEQ